MDDRIVGKALQVGARRIWHFRVVELRAYLVTVVEAANQNGERAATMGQIDPEFRMAVEHAAENQVASGDRGLDRIAEQVREVIGLGAIAAQRRQWMQENRQVKRLDARKDWFK